MPPTQNAAALDIADLWELVLQFEYDRSELVAGLEAWLGPDRSKRILDCACGTGFPALDLIQRGYDVTCTDGSARMLEDFRRNTARAGLDVTPMQVEWRELAEHFRGRFDVVMCRGSSLIYAGVWDGDGTPDPSAIQEALRNFRECLAPGGVLYVDTTAEQDLDRPQRNTYPTRLIGSRSVGLSETIDTDLEAHVRTWDTTLTVDGVPYEFERHSYHLPHQKLVEMLTEVGLSSIEKVRVRGEHYDVFVARA